MAFTYTVVVQETKPVAFAPGTFWLKASIGLFTIKLGDVYTHIAAGRGNLSLADGVYYKTVTEQSGAPTSPSITDIWLQNNNVYWVYLGQWSQFGGN